ncbi:MAG TPA: FAD-dependent oxidoreductase [Candidatus Limnocylindrales bacterium]|nr:FAD-dependent oxidoreductase [Candidatus Limnocylindrales bacterium]
MPSRHLIVGGGTAGLNAIRTIREEDGGASEITLVSAERPYSRMVLPYYLGKTIAESHVFTATPASLAAWKAKALIGRKAASLDTNANTLTLDDGSTVEYDDCLIATGSRAVKPPIPGADGPNVHCFWTLDEARAVIAGVNPGTRVVMVGAGFSAFTILNAILARGAKLTIIEVAPRILPRMVDAECAAIAQTWLEANGVAVQIGVNVTKIEPIKGKSALHFKKGPPLLADVVIMATGIRTNLEWLAGSGVEVADNGQGGIPVDDHLRSNVRNVYAAGDVARGANRVTGAAEVHAIEPTAQEHGRVVGANMAGRDVAHRGSLLMNIVEICHLDMASFGQWDDVGADVYRAVKPERSAYRKLLFHGGRLTGAMICGRASDVWTTNDVGMLKGLVYSGVDLSAWKEHLKQNPFDIKPAFMATRTTARLLPETVLSRPSLSPELPQTVVNA